EMPILILMALGTVFVFSASANVSSSYDLQKFYNFTTLKQLLFFPLAVAIMYLVSRIDYNRFSITRNGYLKSFSPYLLILTIALLIVVLIPGFGVENSPVRRWLSIPLGPASVSFQPSELAKWAVVIFLAALLDFFGNSIKQYKKRFLPICAITGIVCALIVTQDFGTAAFIAFIVFLMLLIAGARWWHFLTPLPVILPALYFAIASTPYRIERLRAFFIADSQSPAAYHGQQSLIAISTGGIWGKGLGHGISKYGHLPEDTTDFIFAIISEELGFAGSFAVIALFAILVIASVILVRRCNSIFGRMLASAIIITIALQAVVNIGVVTVVLPTKGIPLPFVSAGGTSLLLSAAAAGILLNIARQTFYENNMSASIARMHHLIGSTASEPDIVSHTETVLDASAYKTAENRVFSTRWAPFAEDDPAKNSDIIEDEVEISALDLAYDEAISMEGNFDENAQVDTTAEVMEAKEDIQIDAVSVAGNVNAMVSDDHKIENKPAVTNPLFEINVVDKPANQTRKNPQPLPRKEVTASSQLPDTAEKAAGDFLFDAELESKALRAANAISWDEEEDPDEIWMGGSSVNSSSNKNFWEET
ncbi:MAG: cell division protein FtsW, partial [Planctomycetes bacterium]|nr:cell division protein FtsW [Planctomycetota bacterium]